MNGGFAVKIESSMKLRFSSEIEVLVLCQLKLAHIAYLKPIFGAYRCSFPGVDWGGGRVKLAAVVPDLSQPCPFKEG